MEHVKVDGESIPTLIDLLKHNTYNIRFRARVELSERDTDDVIKATQKWLKTNKEPSAQLEGLWVHQQHNVVNKELLQSLLKSSESNARVAAKTVEQFWRDRL